MSNISGHITMQMNFCRRCGESLKLDHDHIFLCKNGHIIFRNASPAAGILLVNDQKETLAIVRGLDPGKGKLDMVGGFCDGEETEHALQREIQEEIGLSPSDYETPQFLFSHIDPYEYKGEVLPILSITFWAYIKPNAKPRPADDVTEAIFIKRSDIIPGVVHFGSYTEALKLLSEKGIIT